MKLFLAIVLIFTLFGLTKSTWWDWTSTGTGCSCYFDLTRMDCACCNTNGCQCGSSYPDRCIECDTASVNCEAKYKANWWDWTSSPTGCPCYYEAENTNCACCKENGCQCGPTFPDRCIQCGAEYENCEAVAPPTTPAPQATQTCGNKILIPLYVWPGNVVTENNVPVCQQIEYVQAANGEDKVISIINVNDGTGAENAAVLSLFKTCASLLKTSGNKVIGYVATGYGEREKSLVKEDINKWYNDFGTEILDGIFLDETISIYESQTYIPKYTEYVAYIRNKQANAIVISNCGQDPPYELLTVSGLSTIVGYEKPYSKLQPPCRHYDEGTLWCQSSHESSLDDLTSMLKSGSLSPSQLSALIYDTNLASLNTALDAAVKSYAGLIYVTDKNVWSALPSYWQHLVSHSYFKKC